MLSTVHSAKGLEWDAVHLIAAYDGNFPADMSTGTEEGVAEERRLLYVALTRARRQAARLCPVSLLPPSARRRRRAWLRQGVALLDRCRAAAVPRYSTAEPPVPAEQTPPVRRIEVSVDALFG